MSYEAHSYNVLVKYADDAYLLVGSGNLPTAPEQFTYLCATVRERQQLTFQPH